MRTKKGLNERIGNRIRQLRLQNHMTQENLAERLNKSTNFLSDIENGRAGASSAIIVELCNIFNTSADALICGETDFNADIRRIAEKISKVDTTVLPSLETMIDAFIKAVGLVGK